MVNAPPSHVRTWKDLYIAALLEGDRSRVQTSLLKRSVLSRNEPESCSRCLEIISKKSKPWTMRFTPYMLSEVVFRRTAAMRKPHNLPAKLNSVSQIITASNTA